MPAPTELSSFHFNFSTETRALIAQWDPEEIPVHERGKEGFVFVDDQSNPISSQPTMLVQSAGHVLLPNVMGGEFKGRIQSPNFASNVLKVQVHFISAVQELVLAMVPAGLEARWNQPEFPALTSSQSFIYQFTLLDENNRVIARPSGVVFDGTRTELTVPTESLMGGKTYKVVVRATLDGSLGERATSEAIFVGSAPTGDPVLEQLVQTLRAAISNDVLLITQSLFGTSIPDLRSQFELLLGLTDGTLGMERVVLQGLAGKIVLHGRVALFERRLETLATIERQNGNLQLRFRAALGNSSFADLRAKGFLEAATPPPAWESLQPALLRVRIEFDALLQQVVATGNVTSAPVAINTGLNGVTFGNFTPVFTVQRSSARTKTFFSLLRTELLAGSLRLPATLQLPGGETRRWNTTIEGGPVLQSMAELNGLLGFTPTDIPAALLAHGAKIVSGSFVFLETNPEAATARLLLDVRPGGPVQWQPAGLDLSATIVFHLSRSIATGPPISFSGLMRNTAGYSSDFRMIPDGGGTFTIEATTDVDSPNINTLAPFWGDLFSRFTAVVSRIGAFDLLRFQSLKFKIRPDSTPAVITSIETGHLIGSWRPAKPDRLVFESPVLKVRGTRPPSGSPGQIDIAGVEVRLAGIRAGGPGDDEIRLPVFIDFQTPGEWIMSLASTQAGVNVARFDFFVTESEIAQLSRDMSAGPPNTPGGGLPDIFGLTVRFNIASNAVEEMGILLRVTVVTRVAGFEIRTMMGQFTRRAGVLTATLTGQMVTGNLTLFVSSTRSIGQPLVFTGITTTDIDFVSMITNVFFSYPSTIGLPAALNTRGQLTITDGGQPTLSCATSENWVITFGESPLTIGFRMENLGGVIEPSKDSKPASARLNGDFIFGKGSPSEFRGPGTLQLPASANTSAIVAVEATLAAGTANPGQLADAVAGPGVYGATPSGALQKPSALATTGTTVRINFTDNTLLIAGPNATAGQTLTQTALYIKAKEGGGFGFLLAAGLASAAPPPAGTPPPAPSFTAVSASLDGLGVFNFRRESSAVVITNLGTNETPVVITDPALADRVPVLPRPPFSVVAGLNFFSAVEIAPAPTDSFYSRFRRIANLSGRFLFSAHIASENAAVTLRASTPTFTLLDFLEMTGPRIELEIGAPDPEKNNERSKRFKIESTTSLRLGAQVLSFNGTLELREFPPTSARFRAVTSTSLANPLDIPFVSYENIGADAFVRFKGDNTNDEIALVGTVRFGSTVQLDARVIWIKEAGSRVNRTPKMAVIEIKQPKELSLSALIAKFTEAEFPSDALDISLHDGELAWVPGTANVTRVRIKDDGDVEDVEYTPGLHAKAVATVFGVDIELDATVHPKSTVAGAPAKGLEASGQFSNAIDFGFAKISGPDDKGPRLTIDTRPTPRTYKIEGSVKFLETDLGAVEMTVTRDSVNGEITPATGPFQNQRIKFTVTKNPATGKRKFKVEGWHLLDVRLPTPPTLTNVKSPSRGNCPNFHLFDSLTVDGSWDLNLDLDISPGEGATPAQIKVTARPVYSATLNRSSNPAITVRLDPFDFTIDLPSSGAMDRGGFLVSVINTCAQTLVDVMANNAGQFAAIAAMNVVGPAANGITDYLLCKARDEGIQMAREAAQDAVKALFSEVGSDVALFGGALVAVGGLTKLISLIGNPPPQPADPQTPTAAFTAGKLEIDWAGSNSSNVTIYIVRVGTLVKRVQWRTKHISIDPAELPMGTRVSIDVQGEYTPRVSGRTAAVFVNLPPAAPVVTLVSRSLNVNWTAVQWNVTGVQYELTVAKTDGTVLARLPLTTGTSAQVSTWDFPAGNPLNVRVSVRATHAQGGNVTSPTAAVSVPVSLAAPQNLAVSLIGSSIRATWTATPGVTYEARLLDGAGNEIRVVSTAESNISFARTLVTGTTLRIQVRAVSSTAFGMAATSGTVTLVTVPPPTNMVATINAATRKLNVGWTPATGAQSHALAVLKTAAGTTLPPLNLTFATSPAEIDIGTDPAGVTYGLELRTIIGGNQSTAARLTVAAPATPTIRSASFDGTAFRVDVTSSVQVEATVSTAGTADVTRLLPGSGGIVSGSFAGGRTYSIRVTAIVSGSRSLPSEAVLVVVPAAPTALTLTVVGGECVASWQAVAGTGVVYSVEVLNSAGNAPNPAVLELLDRTGGSTSASFRLAPNAPAGSNTIQIRVRASQGSNQGPATSITQAITVLDASEEADIQFDPPQTVRVPFQNVTGATQYVVSLEVQGMTVAPVIIGGTTGTDSVAEFRLPSEPTTGTAVKATITAAGNGVLGKSKTVQDLL